MDKWALHRECKMQAYFTVEAALVLPLVLGIIFLVIYLWFYQYNRCLMELDMNSLALKGSVASAQDKTELLYQMKSWAGEINMEKFIAWQQGQIEIKLEKDTVLVERTGAQEFPIGEMDFWGGESFWEADAVYENHRISPVLTVRNLRKILEEE